MRSRFAEILQLRQHAMTASSTNQIAAAAPFAAFLSEIRPQSELRAAITAAYRRPESACLEPLLDLAATGGAESARIREIAGRLVTALRANARKGGVEGLIHEYALSSQEGIALMCLAEALLRIPDAETRDALIRDKISTGDWRSHVGHSPSLFVNAATWGLADHGQADDDHERDEPCRIAGPPDRAGRRAADPQGRRCRDAHDGRAVRDRRNHSGGAGEQPPHGGPRLPAIPTTCSAKPRPLPRTPAATLAAYEHAIHAIGKAAAGRGIYEGPGISIKLSALLPALCPQPDRPRHGRTAAAGEAARDAGPVLRHRPQHRCGGGGPARTLAGHPRSAVPRSGAGGLERHRLRRPGLRQALPLRDRLADRSGAAPAPPDHGAPGQGRILGRRDQARAGGWAEGFRSSPARCTPTCPISPARASCSPRRMPSIPQFATHNAQTLAGDLSSMAGPIIIAASTSSSACTAWASRCTRRWSGRQARTGPAASTRPSARTRRCSPIWCAVCWRTAPTHRSSTASPIRNVSIDDAGRRSGRGRAGHARRSARPIRRIALPRRSVRRAGRIRAGLDLSDETRAGRAGATRSRPVAAMTWAAVAMRRAAAPARPRSCSIPPIIATSSASVAMLRRPRSATPSRSPTQCCRRPGRRHRRQSARPASSAPRRC